MQFGFLKQRSSWLWITVGAIILGLIFWYVWRGNTSTDKAGQERIQQGWAKLEQSTYSSPFVYSFETNTFSFRCVLESISYLKEGHYITFGDYNIRVTGQCSYLDINGDKQTVTVALWIENTKNNTTWLPHNGILGPYRTSVSRTQEVFERYTSIEPGDVLGIALGLAGDSNNGIFPGAAHNGELIDQLYTQEMLDTFAATKRPDLLPNKLVIPLNL